MWQVVMVVKAISNREAAEFILRHLREEYVSADDPNTRITIELQEDES